MTGFILIVLYDFNQSEEADMPNAQNGKDIIQQ